MWTLLLFTGRFDEVFLEDSIAKGAKKTTQHARREERAAKATPAFRFSRRTTCSATLVSSP